ncbi:very-long-chain (3R)-3-hydroxyacyl-CoA dehydratase PASTICCINO 2B-like [Carica papaya]|uniref:very-long-chain (3R)-3-hydroxyacyl-CoA dehydratase PASTICCINO 2B-like n=1 Tax=Carica papaya TaxID=3649 RepID=UPI000B8C6EFC|nr:very-long-chain (3R)-3-hydroxyacyl-CoA dehydratase PASTICCINO 2B-like [Carica papaya]
MAFLSPLRRFYLAAYNWVLFIGWFQVLYICLRTLKDLGHEQVYHAVETSLQLAQTASALEIIHSLVGLVKSPVTITFPQIGSRLYLTWEILWNFTEIQSNVFVTFLVLSWSLTEIVRHSFFAMKETFGSTPFWLLWLRYSTFLLLQPTGIFSEIVILYYALPLMKETCKRMLEKIHLYVLIMILAIYIPGGLFVHWHLHGQRKKALSKSKGD